MIRELLTFTLIGFILFCAFLGAFWLGSMLAGGPV